ncbi:ROK family protein [Actinomadura gamaensis]|uniref:ROK family protein n=1 Tax=Actinomadura gamaensis TaxID=1763541 RepID=A0ABV9TW12_9ACTN
MIQPPAPAARPAPHTPATGARQSSLREANLALVVRTVLAAPAPPTRAAVAAATGMTRATAARLVDELVEGGVLDERDPPEAAGRGRPARPLAGGRRIAALGLQVNVTFLAGRVLDLSGGVLAEFREPGDFRASDPAAVLARLGDLARSLVASLPDGTRLVGTGVALPGIVSADTGTLLVAPNLGWSDVRPADHLGPPGDHPGVPGGHLGVPGAHVGNEAEMAARSAAESAPGRPGPVRDFLYLSGEIGLGGATVLGGAVVPGRHGWAGEIGHVCVDPDGPPCPCGSTGCLERYAGRDALLGTAGLPLDAPLSALADRVRAGDPAARRAVDAAVRALGVALSGAINLLDVPVVLLGGHLAEIAELIVPRLRPVLERRVLSARWVTPRVEAHAGGPAPGATGAALLRLADVVQYPSRWL